MRRTALLFTLPLLPILAAAFDVACGGDDSGGVHGQVFSVDGGETDGTVITTGDGSFVEPDGSTNPDGSTTLPDGAVACTTGSVAVFGGGASDSFGSVSTGSGAFTTQNFAGVSTVALPSAVSFGTGFQAVFHAGGSNALMSSAYASPTWTTPAAISGTLVREMPTLAAEGTTLHLVYQANDDAGTDEFKYFHGTLSGSTWTAGDPMGSGAGQSSGPHAPGAAGLPFEVVTGQVGGDSNIYARSFTTSWQSAMQITGGTGDDGTFGTAARVVALTGSTADVMLVYTADTTNTFTFAKRTSGVWTTPAQVNSTAYTTEPFNLAALSGGGAIITWRGADSPNKGYATVFNGTSWSTPVPITTVAVTSAPAVSHGNCGSVAIATYAKADGTVETIRYDGTNWANVESVTGAANATFVSIAVSP